MIILADRTSSSSVRSCFHCTRLWQSHLVGKDRGDTICSVCFSGKNKYICNMNKRTINTMLPKIQSVLKGQPVVRAWIFGSYSRGEETPLSDVDILVQYDENARITLLTISRIMTRLSEAVGKKVDLVEDGCLLPFAQESANRDKILIYERAS